MPGSNKERYTRLAVEREQIEKQMRELAWQIVPDNIKELLCGENGLFSDEEKSAKWLIKPLWEFDEKCPAKLIIDGEAEKVILFLEKLTA